MRGTCQQNSMESLAKVIVGIGKKWYHWRMSKPMKSFHDFFLPHWCHYDILCKCLCVFFFATSTTTAVTTMWTISPASATQRCWWRWWWRRDQLQCENEIIKLLAHHNHITHGVFAPLSALSPLSLIKSYLIFWYPLSCTLTKLNDTFFLSATRGWSYWY